jgi:hypothetical protein
MCCAYRSTGRQRDCWSFCPYQYGELVEIQRGIIFFTSSSRVLSVSLFSSCFMILCILPSFIQCSFHLCIVIRILISSFPLSLSYIYLPLSKTRRFWRKAMKKMKMAVFWIVAPCSPVEVYRRFRGACCLYHQGDDKYSPRKQPSSYSPP